MASLKEVRTRIASVSSTQQVTSAMKMVSAAKFRRAQMAIMGMRPYAAQLNEIISDINVGDGVQTPYHEIRKLEKVLLVVVTSNKGLCGAFNSNVIKLASSRIDYYREEQKVSQLSLITIGRRASEFFSKTPGLVAESHDDLLDKTSFDEVASLAEMLMERYCNKMYDRVELIYNQFKNSLTQVLTSEQFLPVLPRAIDKKAAKTVQNDYIYEPNKESILQEMIPLTLRSQFYRVILDSLAALRGSTEQIVPENIERIMEKKGKF